MNRLIISLLATALVLCSFATSDAQRLNSSVTGSVKRIFIKSASYINFINNVSEPLKNAVKQERDLYDTLSGGHDRLAAKDFIEEAAKLEQNFETMRLPLSKTDKRRVYSELKTKADYLRTVQVAIHEAKQSAKWFSENVPNPRLVSVGEIENLWLEELPAAGKAISQLRGAITDRMREIEREVDINGDPSLDGETPGSFSLFDLNENVPHLENEVMELLQEADAILNSNLDEAVSELDTRYHELLSDFRSISDYIKTLQTARDGLPESERFLRDKYDSTIANAAEYQKAIVLYGSAILNKKSELEKKRSLATSPNKVLSIPSDSSPKRQGASIETRNQKVEIATRAVHAQESQLEEFRWQATYDRYQENLRASIGQNRRDWQIIHQTMSQAREGRQAYLDAIASQTMHRGTGMLEQQTFSSQQRLNATLHKLDPVIQTRIQESGIDKWQAQEQAAWEEAVKYGKAQSEIRASSMMDKAIETKVSAYVNNALQEVEVELEDTAKEPGSENKRSLPKTIPKQEDAAPPAPKTWVPEASDLFGRSSKDPFEPVWYPPLHETQVRVLSEKGAGELRMGVAGNAREIDLLRPFFMSNPDALQDLVRENPKLLIELQPRSAVTKASEIRERGWYDFIKEGFFGKKLEECDDEASLP